MLRRALRLRTFIAVSLLVATGLALGGATLVSSYLLEQQLHDSAEQSSRVIARQAFSNMLQAMRQGWDREEVRAFTERLEAQHSDVPVEVTVFRGERVEALYGRVEAAEPADAAVAHALEEGTAVRQTGGHTHRHVIPLEAEARCLDCHANAEAGEVLGAIDVTKDLEPYLAGARQEFWVLFLAAAPLLLAGAGGVAYLTTRRLDAAVERFREEAEQVRSVEDVRSLGIPAPELRFAELNGLLASFQEVVHRLRAATKDRDVLEQEARLLERYIITSEVISDWRRAVSRLVLDINAFHSVPAVFTSFGDGSEEPEVAVFWRYEPGQASRSAMEQAILDAGLPEGDAPGSGRPGFRHYVVDKSSMVAPLDPAALTVATRRLRLESPPVRGAVGMALPGEGTGGIDSSAVVDGLLATLLNLVGSARAIEHYKGELEQHASRDPLTRFYNQHVFRDLAQHEVERARQRDEPLTLAIADLDNLLPINARYGHAFGDSYLTAFAEALREATRSEDVIARYGNDEFAILMPGLAADEACAVAEGIVARARALPLSAPDGRGLGTSCSIGIAGCPEHGSSAQELLTVADHMLSRAKEEGKHAVRAPDSAELADLSGMAGEVGATVLQALEERRIVPYFQPIAPVQGQGGTVHELLMRIEQEDGTILPAGQFIAVAERMGVVARMDQILLDRALEHMSRWGCQGTLFVNISARSLVAEDLISGMREACRHHGIEPGRVVLELTEREGVRNLSRLQRFVEELRREGFGFAVDDFGSGFSSFQFVRSLPVDYIKIEGEFVRNMAEDAADRAFVVTIATLAQELGLRTVAEFVESGTVLEAAREVGIDYAQGFHVGRPGPELCAGRGSRA